MSSLPIVTETLDGQFYNAVLFDDCTIMLYLINKGFDINKKDFESGSTALHYAASKGSCNAISLLINLGSQVKSYR